MKNWFRRLAEVPDIEYKTDPAINRSQLPGHNAVPTINRYEFDGRRIESRSWPMESGRTGASPAQSWKTQPRKGETEAQTALRQLREALELPGTLSDYHFAIQTSHDSLRGFAREEPWVLEEVERLCVLDIRLINQYPEIITPEPITIEDKELRKLAAERRQGMRSFAHVTAFHQLIRLYEREGYLREAMDVAKIAQKFEQCPGKVEEIQERINRIGAEPDAA